MPFSSTHLGRALQFASRLGANAALLLLAIVLSPSRAHATWGFVQHKENAPCSSSSSTCAVTVTSTGSGHVGVILGIAGSNSTTATISSVSGGGTWTVPPSSGCSLGNSAPGGMVSCAYTLSTAASATSITVTWGTSSPGSYVSVDFYEFSFTASSVALDKVGTQAVTTAAANLPGVTLTLTGTNDVIVQAGQFSASATACASPYNTNSAFPNGNAACYAINQSSGTAVTYTNTSSSAVFNAIAIKEVSATSCKPSLALLGAGAC
jgi:hypothetical protein